MIYDHIIKGGATELEAISLLPDYGGYDEDEHWHWRGDCVIPDLKIITQEATYDETGVLITPEVTLEGFWVAIGLSNINEELKNLPDNACRLIANRDTTQIVYVSPVVDPSILTTARVSPVFQGSTYTFGV